MRNRKLSLSFADCSLGEFTRQLNYKAEMRGKEVIEVGRFYASSQICSNCLEKNSAVKDLSVRSWQCPNCQVEHDRDINAANNVLREDLALLALRRGTS